jgi:hypothetical protein
MKALTLLFAGLLFSDQTEAASGWRTPASAGALASPQSVIAGFHKYVCKTSYPTYAPFGSLVFDQGKMQCESYAMIRSQPTSNKESTISNYQVLDASAPNAWKWAPVAQRDPILSGLAKPLAKDLSGNDVYVCRTSTPDKEDTISGSYMLVNGKWACLVALPNGPLTVPLSGTAQIDLLVLN